MGATRQFVAAAAVASVVACGGDGGAVDGGGSGAASGYTFEVSLGFQGSSRGSEQPLTYADGSAFVNQYSVHYDD